MHTAPQRGIVCRLISAVFGEIERRQQETEASFACRCSYLEIYKEQITDLLEPSPTNLLTREDQKRGIYVDKLTEQRVWHAADALGVLRKGMHARHVGATQMNELSSRSHAVFTIIIESKDTAAGVTSTRTAKINLVDLAGSERQHWWGDQPGATLPHQEACRVKEAGAINKSLSALTN